MFNWRRSLTLIAPWAVAILVLVWGYSRVPPRYTYTADSFMRYFQAEGFRLTGEDTLLYAFADADPDYRYYPLRTSNYLIRDAHGRWRAPFPFAFAAPAAGLLAAAGRDYAPLFSGAAFLLALAVLQRGLRLSLPILLLTSVGTALPIYALDFGEVIYAALLIALGLAVWLGDERRPFLRGLAAGALIGLAAMLRLETLALGLALSLAQLIAADLLRPARWRRAVREPAFLRTAGFVAGIALLFGIFAAYNVIQYGLLFGPKLAADGDAVGALSRRVEIMQTLLLGADTFGTWKPGFLGLTPLFAAAFLPLAFRSLRTQGGPGERAIVYALPIYVALILLTAPHDGAWSWGARYLTPAAPLALIILDRLLKRVADWPNARSIPVFAACAALTVFSASEVRRGVQILHGAAGTMQQFEAGAVNARGALRLFDNPAVAFQLGPEYLSGDGALIRDSASLDALIPLIESRYAGREVVYFAAPLFDIARAEFLPDAGPFDRAAALERLSRRWTLLPDPPPAAGLLTRRFRIPAP